MALRVYAVNAACTVNAAYRENAANVASADYRVNVANRDTPVRTEYRDATVSLESADLKVRKDRKVSADRKARKAIPVRVLATNGAVPSYGSSNSTGRGDDGSTSRVRREPQDARLVRRISSAAAEDRAIRLARRAAAA
jgi:hypothetical protein